MTNIEWTEKTWNPIVGCSIVSPGCTNCYAMKMAARIEAIDEVGYRKAVAHAVETSPWAGYAEDENRIRAEMNNSRTPSHYAGTTQASKAGPVWTGRVALAPDHILTEPLRRKKPTMWFVNSMGDLFHEDVPDDWIDRVFAMMALCPQHTFQVLTKRSARMRDYFDDTDDRAMQIGVQLGDMLDGDWIWGEGKQYRQQIEGMISLAHGMAPNDIDRAIDELLPLPNVWLGISAERQTEADERIPDLLATPAAVRFVSAEPLIGPVDFTRLDQGKHRIDALQSYIAKPLGGGMWEHEPTDAPSLDWIIVGGESGPGARPMHPDWARSIRDQCAAADVPFFFKQFGAWMDGSDHRLGEPRVVFNDGTTAEWSRDAALREDKDRGWHDRRPCLMTRVGKARAGRLLDGRTWDEMPINKTGNGHG